jgi:tetratricopeptide (TPR) repeat protein
VTPLLAPLGRLRMGRQAYQKYREGVRLFDSDDLGGAEPLLRESFDLALKSGDRAQIARSAEFFYYVLWCKRRYDEAAPVLELKVDCHRRLEGLDGDGTIEWRDELIWVYGRLQRYEAAETLARESVESIGRRFGTGAYLGFALSTMAWAQRKQGRLEEAEALYRQALELIEKKRGQEDDDTGWPLVGLALIEEGRGRLDLALEHARRAWANWERVGRVNMAQLARDKVIDLYIETGAFDEALKVAQDTVLRHHRVNDDEFEDPAVRLREAERVARIFAGLGRPEEARRMEVRARYIRQSIERDEAERLALIERVGESAVAARPRSAAAAELGGPVFFDPAD